ncbi:hypothetical protein [Helicobacter sp. MIT 01-3238]|uniref:hypothetical protein n=1 Tax=Helicobacter sp. MIT 01-3238 TaxID=398627 RepID=UPI00216266AC|nr:hypothetical protein [Helicobacter sp. MIT 01-3238]
MNPNTLRIFELCNELATLLSDKQAIADLQVLLDRHPEMFRDIESVENLIKNVIEKPDIIVKNPTPQSEKDYIAGKKLDDKKMGEVGIRKDGNASKIFHANEKRLKNLGLLAKKEIVVDGRCAHTPYTQAQSLDGRLVDNNISSTTTRDSLAGGRCAHFPHPDLENQLGLVQKAHSPASESNSTKQSAQSQSKPKIRRKQ